MIEAGQIIATSHDRFSPKWWFSKGNPLISGKSGLVKHSNLTRKWKVYSSNKRQFSTAWTDPVPSCVGTVDGSEIPDQLTS